MKITYRKLCLLGACKEQRDQFRELWPKGVEITEELCIAHASEFDWHWAAVRLLPASALAEYRRVHAAAWAEYMRVGALALAKYKRVEASAWAEYKRVKASALAKYERVKASALAEYERVKAAAFGRLASC